MAADFEKKDLGFVYKGSDEHLCVTTFAICFEDLGFTTYTALHFSPPCELMLNLIKSLATGSLQMVKEKRINGKKLILTRDETLQTLSFQATKIHFYEC